MKQPIPTPIPVRRTRTRKLTVIVEGRYGEHQRLELLIAPGTRVSELPLDESHCRLVQPGGSVLAGSDDLFEIAADTPKLFALRDAPPRVCQPALGAQRRSGLSRVLRRGGRAIAAIIALPKPRQGVAP